MNEALIIGLAVWVIIKTLSYGVWELKNKNKLAGISAVVLTSTVIFLTYRYFATF